MQQYHLQAIRRSFPYEYDTRLLQDGDPAPDLEGTSPVFMAYCDNLNVGSRGAESSPQDGFHVHGIEGLALRCRVLGNILDGEEWLIRPDHARAWRLLLAFQWLAQGPVVSAGTVRVLLGHAIVVLTLKDVGAATHV